MDQIMLSHRAWQYGLGLLPISLYKERDTETRHVLLNGVAGNFCLDEGLDSGTEERSAIAWSSNIGHHITVSPGYVEVVRWDRPDAVEKYTASSVSKNLEEFHRYLEKSSPDSSNSVVSHALGVYRSLRSSLREESVGTGSLSAFLYLLGCAASDTNPGSDLPRDWQVSPLGKDLFGTINSADQGYHFDRLMGRIGSFRMLKPDFGLLLRHASGALFQEAHAQVQLPDEGWLPGLGPLDAVLNTRSLGINDGAYFTPPSIARTLAEEALRELDIGLLNKVVIFDPACGSGELLKEALRILEIQRFDGSVVLRGWDQSNAAVDIAKFSLGWEVHGWNGRVQVEIECVNSVTTPQWPTDVNVVLMNPPFKSWQQMTLEEQDAVQLQLSGLQSNKPNLASVFISRASTALVPGGVLASVAPRSFFDASSARKLRETLLNVVVPTVIVNLANPSLYTHATVQSGLFVAKRGRAGRPTALVWTDPRPSSVGEALRGLRRYQLESNVSINEDGYSIYRDPGVGTDARSWLPKPYEGWALGKLLNERSGVVSAKSIFHIHQGVRMGSDAFLVSPSFVEGLSAEEKKYFRPAVTNANLSESKLVAGSYIFYPYTEGLERIESEQDLQRLVPKYYSECLEGYKRELSSRKSLEKAGQPWWGLIWPREWQYEIKPKLVSKYFGKSGSFAWDKSGEYVVVVGHGWVPRDSKKHWAYISSQEYSLAVVAILASSLGELLLSQSSVQVGGGQWDLSSKYVGEIPLLAPTQANSRVLRDLALWGEKISSGERLDRTELDEFVYGAYGVPNYAVRA